MASHPPRYHIWSTATKEPQPLVHIEIVAKKRGQWGARDIRLFIRPSPHGYRCIIPFTSAFFSLRAFSEFVLHKT
ncbi:hypothetical protein AFLA_007224 [Aspergillus flavus NRRL3357]|nr:hypothetical protein AFLA_007224 [Aspergillus flavus NRRL3357]